MHSIQAGAERLRIRRQDRSRCANAPGEIGNRVKLPLAVGGIEKMSGRSVARQPSDGFGGTEERQCGLRAIEVGPFEEQDC